MSLCGFQSSGITGNILSRATFQGAPSYGGMRTWMEGSNLLGYKEYVSLKTMSQFYVHVEN